MSKSPEVTKAPLRIGIEIGGTKLQAGLGTNAGQILQLERRVVDRPAGAAGIRTALVSMLAKLFHAAEKNGTTVESIGIGFGGPVDVRNGHTIQSFQISGWENFPLKKWAEDTWQRPTFINNDASVAGLAESLYGNGKDVSRMFYITIGSGIGGGFILDNRIDDGQGLGSGEIGHCHVPDPTSGKPLALETICSGWAIGQRAREAAQKRTSMMTALAGTNSAIDARTVYLAAEQGDPLANKILTDTCQTLGVAIANIIALLHPQRIIIGGGVSLMGTLFWDQLRSAVAQATFPLFANNVAIHPAALGEAVVVTGALALIETALNGDTTE